MELTIKNIDKKKFFFNIILPTLLTIGLFIVLIFFFIIPYFETNLIRAKKEMIREIVSTAIGIASKYDTDYQHGVINKEEAQRNTISVIESIRYGMDNKDYLWITDMHPRMIMHPYRKDLNGLDLSNFSDPMGKRLFVAFVVEIKKNGSGYVDYMWQWMDDSTRIVSKISYVAAYKPWNWIIGTGVYIEDVRKEIASIKFKLILVSLAISLIMALLLFSIIKRNLQVEIQRTEAEYKLSQSRERYKALVEASTDGTIMFLDNKVVYINAKITELLSPQVIETITPDLSQIIPTERSNDVQAIRNFYLGNNNSFDIETQIISKSTTRIDALVTISKVITLQKDAIIIIIKDLSFKKSYQSQQQLANAFETLSESNTIGVFKTTYGKLPKVVAINSSAMELLGIKSEQDISNINIANFIDDDIERKTILINIIKYRKILGYPLKVRKSNGDKSLVYLYATTQENEHRQIQYIVAAIIDVSGIIKPFESQKWMIQKFLQYQQIAFIPVSHFIKQAHCISHNASINDAVRLMKFYKTNVLLVQSYNNDIIGIITAKNIAECTVIPIDNKPTVISIMQTPKFILGNTVLYKTLSLFENDTDYLVVKNTNNSLLGALSKDEIFKQLSNYYLLTNSVTSENITKQEIAEHYNLLTNHIKHIVNAQSTILSVTAITTRYSDILTQQILPIIFSELGVSPVPFAIIALGSEGRKEQTLLTDQDNAIIYQDIENNTAIHNYFIKLGSRFNYLLNQAGYKFCKGNIMASNPQWCQPLNVWKTYFTQWIKNPEPQNLLDLSIFFDYRTVFGNDELTTELRRHIDSLVANNAPFLLQMAMVCSTYKLPIDFFGRLQTNIQPSKKDDSINIKSAIRILVHIVRLYAMKHLIPETNTIERLQHLHEKNIFPTTFYLDLFFSYNFLLSLQFKYQTYLITKNLPADNNIAISFFSDIEIATLKNIFSKLSLFQNKIKFDFDITSL